jgi:glycosyltransferase involved in cell wall biosynthesis
MSTRLGLLAYATDTGVGHLTRAVQRHLRPVRTMVVVDARTSRPAHPEWYPGEIVVHGRPDDGSVDRFLDGLDAVFVCESPLNYRLFSRARERGVRTVLQFMYEFLDYLAPQAGAAELPLPDVLAAPSPWLVDELPDHLSDRVVHLPVPIDLDELPQREIVRARHFFHVAGRPARRDRNGTLDFIAAARLAALQRDDLTFTVSCQRPTPAIEAALRDGPVRLAGHLPDRRDLYREGDVLVLPRRYGGLCLPAQEAVGCGIPVLMTDVEPNRSWLPASWLVQARWQRERVFVWSVEVEACRVHVEALADRMLEIAGDDERARTMHAEARAIARSASWDVLRPRYEAVLAGACAPAPGPAATQ